MITRDARNKQNRQNSTPSATRPSATRRRQSVADMPTAPDASSVPPQRHRPTEAERITRIDTILGLLISGIRRAEILQFTAEKWGLSERQTDEYIAAATEVIRAEAAKTREEKFAEHIAFRRQIRKRAMGDGDWRAALAAAQDEARLLGLYPAEQVRHSGAIQHQHITFRVVYEDDANGSDNRVQDQSASSASTTT